MENRGLDFLTDRRGFLRSAATAGSLSLSLSPFALFRELFAAEPDPTRLSWLAHRGTQFEGSWSPRSIEGALPTELSGTLFRTGPGSKLTQGTKLKHFFDGDALVTALGIKNGQVSIRSRFVQTAERVREQKAATMLYDDYGTPSPKPPLGYKYSPNIHVLPVAGKLLALSESSHPTALDPETLETIGSWDFHGTLPSDVTFTAHPKADPKTGDIYAFGISKSVFPALKAYRLSPPTGQLTELFAYDLNGFYPTHDMMMTENYLVFVISPVKLRLVKAALTLGTIADILEYDPSAPLRIVIARKDGSEDPIEVSSQPSGLIFHHCNAYEDPASGHLVFHSMLMHDDSAYRLFQAWSQARLPPAPESRITRFEIDLDQETLISRTPVSDGTPTDFPCIDAQKIGTSLATLYALENRGSPEDPLAFDTLASWDLRSMSATRVRCEPRQTLGEAVFVPGQGAGFLLHLGYDAKLDETYLDVRQADTMGLAARVWLGRYLPLGFHGVFV